MLFPIAWLLVASLTRLSTTDAIPIAALKSLVVLRSSRSPHSPPCVAAALPRGLFLAAATSDACSSGSLDAVHAVADVSFVNSDPSTMQLSLGPTGFPSNLPVAWSDTTTLVLRSNGATESAPSLTLPLQAIAQPSTVIEDATVTMISVNATTLQVSAIDGVVYVDHALCGSLSPPQVAATSVCVRPLDMKDRAAVASTPSPDSFRFLVQHDVSSGHHILLGVGLSADADTTGAHRFTWLGASLGDENFARLWNKTTGIAGAGSAAEADRVIGASVMKADNTTAFLADVRYANNWTVCTGALIAPKVVLTSAQCYGFLAYSKLLNITIDYVVLGVKDPTGRVAQEVIPIYSYIRDKRYSSTTHAFDLMMLLRLERASRHAPLPLVTESATSVMGKRGRVFGFGGPTGTGGQQAFWPGARYVDVTIGPTNDVCATRFDRPLDKTRICVASSSDTDGCFYDGDMGAPLVVDAGKPSQRLVGVVSDGVACGRVGLPAVFTRVASMMPLIREAIARSDRPINTPAPATRAADGEAAEDTLLEEATVASRRK